VGEDRISYSNIAISEAEMSTALVLLKKSDVPEAGLRRNQQSWEKLIFCFSFGIKVTLGLHVLTYIHIYMYIYT